MKLNDQFPSNFQYNLISNEKQPIKKWSKKSLVHVDRDRPPDRLTECLSLINSNGSLTRIEDCPNAKIHSHTSKNVKGFFSFDTFDGIFEFVKHSDHTM